MIKNIKTKKLREYWKKGRRLDLPPKAARKVERILSQMEKIETKGELLDAFKTPGFNLRPYYERNYDDDWEIRVSGNYRILFRWDGIDIRDIEYTDSTH